MKYFLIILGCILLLISIYQSFPYLLDYQYLSEYGKGYIWGNIILLIIGVLLLLLGIRKYRSKVKEQE